MQNSTVSVILTGYKRPYTLVQQLRAVQDQTIEPTEIYFVLDNCGDPLIQGQFADIIKNHPEEFKDVKMITSNHNFGVWFRFQVAMSCSSDFICVFDDDTIPGNRWLESCVGSYTKKPGLYGTIGLRFESNSNYYSHTRIGWANPNEEIEKVDIVGHARFFSQKELRVFLSVWKPEKRDDFIWNKCGEDITFSYALQKEGITTYVPPHPKDDKDFRGSNPVHAWNYGADKNANFLQHKDIYNTPFLYSVSNFWNLPHINHFRNEFDEIWNNVFIQKKPFVVTRYGDGERNLMTGLAVGQGSQALSVDHRSVEGGSVSKLGKDLFDTLSHIDYNYVYGIPCSCCNEELKKRYRETLPDLSHLTYANIFINANYKYFCKYIQEVSEPVVVIGNHRGEESMYPFPVKLFVPMPDDCANWYEENGEYLKNELVPEIMSRLGENPLVLISAGPLSEIIIHELHKLNPIGRYIDVGSALDPRIHGKQTRGYMIEGNPYFSKNCVF